MQNDANIQPPPDERDAILYAKTGKLEKLKACLDFGISPNTTDENKASLLMWAAARGHFPVVEELISRGADTNFVGQEHSTALDQAQQQGHTQIVEFLKPLTNQKGNNTYRPPCLTPPQYDIDELLDTDLTAPRVAFKVIDHVYTAIETNLHGGAFRLDSDLSTPEVVVRDIHNFNMALNSGFRSCLGYGGGFQIFFRGLRAVRLIGHKKAIAIAEAVSDVLKANGAREPSLFPEDLRGDCDVDWELEVKDMPALFDQIDKLTRHLDDEWTDIHELLYYATCMYLDANRELLRSRKETQP